MHSVQLSSESGVPVVVAHGELDAYAAPDLDACFERSGRDSSIVIDLSEVSFLDSTALGIVSKTVRQLGERNCQARVVLPRSSARRIFEITMLDRALPVSESRAAALADLARA